MNQPAPDVAYESEQPENQQNDYYGPKHVTSSSLTTFAETESAFDVSPQKSSIGSRTN